MAASATSRCAAVVLCTVLALFEACAWSGMWTEYNTHGRAPYDAPSRTLLVRGRRVMCLYDVCVVGVTDVAGFVVSPECC